jgi:sugar/nucleoside kinase (ribokinase family)
MDHKQGMTRYDVAVIADIFADVVIKGDEKPTFGQVETLADSYEIELGGSGPIFASQFVKLGGTVALLTIVGNDSMGNMILSRIKEIGIDTEYIRQSTKNKTPLGLNISVNEDRSLMTVLGTLNEISADIIDETLLDHIKHWHIAGYFLLPTLIGFWPGFLDILKKKGITCSLDTNWSPLGNWDQVLKILPKVDLFLPNEEEAMAITGKSDYQRAGIELSKLAPLVVIKRGEHGASVFKDGKEFSATNQEYWEGGIKVIDTTGAGDSFDGGFIYEWLKGASLEECLKTAIICGISNVQDIGGIRSQFSQ